MIHRHPKGANVILSPHFHLKEFDCRCHRLPCNYTLVDSDLIDSLERLRASLGTPLKIISGFRCSAWNDKNKGKPGSMHLNGKAVDIACSGEFLTELWREAEQVPLFSKGGMGRALTFIHLDVRGYPARWTY